MNIDFSPPGMHSLACKKVPFEMADVISRDSLVTEVTEWLVFVISADGFSSGGEHRYICDGDADAGGHVCQLPRPRCRTS